MFNFRCSPARQGTGIDTWAWCTIYMYMLALLPGSPLWVRIRKQEKSRAAVFVLADVGSSPGTTARAEDDRGDAAVTCRSRNSQ